MKHLTILSALLALSACGSSQPTTTTTTTTETVETTGTEPTGAEPTEATAPAGTPVGYDTPWADMKYDQKKQVMKKVVMPTMGELFASFDSEYADSDCTLCHGQGAMSGDFEMPNADLPALAFGSPEWPAFEAEHEAILAFMKEKVTPEMVRLLGVEPYSPENPTGFGCFSCHPQPEAQ